MSDVPSPLSIDLMSAVSETDSAASTCLREELEAIFAVRRPDFIRFLARLGVDAVDAEDITQDIFLRMFDTSKTAKYPDRPYEWLLSCARNLALKHFRKRSREVQVIDCVWKKWERVINDPACNTEAQCVAKEDLKRWKEAISTLDAESQQCVLLRCEGVTFREIGAILNLPLRRVVYLTNIALTELQAKLGHPGL